MSSLISDAFPGVTPVQKVATGLTFTAANAGLCALTGHVFSLAPTAAACFGASAGLLGLGLASYFAFDKTQQDVMDRVAKAVISFFGGGALAYLLTNAAGLTMSMPASLLLLVGPVLFTTLGMIALRVASLHHPDVFADASDVVDSVREFFGV